MSNDIYKLNDGVEAIRERLNVLQEDIARYSATPSTAQQIEDTASLARLLNTRRKTLGIDLQTLELQTGVSTSTLKRLFKDVEQVKFGTVYAVAKALGVTLCFDE